MLNLWLQLEEQKLAPGQGSLVPVEVVLDTIQKSLVLIRNASNYISEARRDLIISRISQKQKGLAKILKSVCRETKSEGSALFGSSVHKALTERADTLSALRKASKKTTPTTYTLQGGSNFFRRGPTTEYGGGSGRGKFQKPYFHTRVFQPQYSHPRRGWQSQRGGHKSGGFKRPRTSPPAQ